MVTEIPNVLACDIGNTNISFACVKGKQVGTVVKMRIGELADLGKALAAIWQDMPYPKTVVACSVNPAGTKALEAAVDQTLEEKVLLVGVDIPLPIPTDIKNPDTVGTDRICAAAAAYDRIGQSCVVGDFGTAITIDCVDEKGVFLGGAIIPGLGMSAAALKQNTAALPEVELFTPDWVFGKDTNQAIVGGIVYAARGALRELTEQYATALGQWPTVIITGSDAKLICPDPREDGIVQAIAPDLVLQGVAVAYYNTLIEG